MTFEGACLPLCGVPVLIVIVDRPTLADPLASQRIVDRYRARFRRTIVLMAQDLRGVPTYFGPAGIVKALATLAFEAIPWRRFRVREKRRPRDSGAPMWWLPIPPPLIEGPPSSIDLSCFGPRQRPEDVAVTRDLRCSGAGGSAGGAAGGSAACAAHRGGSSASRDAGARSHADDGATSSSLRAGDGETCLSLRDGDAITRWTPCGISAARDVPRIDRAEVAATPSRADGAVRRSCSQTTRVLSPELRGCAESESFEVEPTIVGTAWTDDAVTEVSPSWPR